MERRVMVVIAAGASAVLGLALDLRFGAGLLIARLRAHEKAAPRT